MSEVILENSKEAVLQKAKKITEAISNKVEREGVLLKFETLIVDNIKPKCAYCTFGDKEVIATSELQAHLEICEYHPMFALKKKLAAEQKACDEMAGILRRSIEINDEIDPEEILEIRLSLENELANHSKRRRGG